ncbi:MAG: hypothetical protein ACRDTV_08695, partial [Mycobacterium sp.]
AKAALKPGGRVLTVDPCYAPGQNPIARFLISKDRGQHVRSPAGYEALARDAFAHVHATVAARAFPPYTHFFMTARMSPEEDSVGTNPG